MLSIYFSVLNVVSNVRKLCHRSSIGLFSGDRSDSPGGHASVIFPLAINPATKNEYH